LLKGHEPADSFLERGPADLDATDNYEQIAECPGAVVGPDKLLQQIGEGGVKRSRWGAGRVVNVRNSLFLTPED
jgi:hypothetical protein